MQKLKGTEKKKKNYKKPKLVTLKPDTHLAKKNIGLLKDLCL